MRRPAFEQDERGVVLPGADFSGAHLRGANLSEANLPILGDPLYGKPPKSDVLKSAAASIHRPALHARVLGFVHPMTGEKMRFESDPPADFQLALTMLRAIP